LNYYINIDQIGERSTKMARNHHFHPVFGDSHSVTHVFAFTLICKTVVMKGIKN